MIRFRGHGEDNQSCKIYLLIGGCITSTNLPALELSFNQSKNLRCCEISVWWTYSYLFTPTEPCIKCETYPGRITRTGLTQRLQKRAEDNLGSTRSCFRFPCSDLRSYGVICTVSSACTGEVFDMVLRESCINTFIEEIDRQLWVLGWDMGSRFLLHFAMASATLALFCPQ